MALLTTALLAGASTATKIFGARRREKEVNDAQDKKLASEQLIRAEQSGRIRRKQIRDGSVAAASAEALGLANGANAGSGSQNAIAGVQNNVNENLGNLNTGLVTGNINAGLNSNIQNAGRKNNFELFNDAVSPAINAGLSNSIAKAFE